MIDAMNSQGSGSRKNLRRALSLEAMVVLVFCLAATHFLLVLMTGGYNMALGPLRMSVSHLEGPLLIVLAASMAIFWLRGRNNGIPAQERLRSPALLFLGVVFVYSLNGRGLAAGDTIPASYLPLSLLAEFDFDLDEFPFLYEPGLPWFVQRIGGHIVSAYPPWAGVLSLPVYLLPVIGGLAAPSPLIHDLEKLSATLITGLSVLLLFYALRRCTDEKIAWIIAVVYAFGTSSFSSSSQALWQHGPSQLFITLTMYWLIRGIDAPRFSAYAGIGLASAILCRPTNVLMAIPVAVYIVCHRRGQLIGFLMAALPPALFLAAYNLHYFGSPFMTGFAGATGPSQVWSGASALFSTPLFEGLLGVLCSPGRGLFLYSPILLGSIVGMVMVWKVPKQVLLKYLSLAPLPLIFLTAKWVIWWGGGSYGPRLLADITPILCLYLYPLFAWVRSRPFLKYVCACLAVLSISLHALRVFGGGDWNGHPNVDRHPERLWSWAASPPVYYGNNLVRDTYAKIKRLALRLPTSGDASPQLAASYRLMDVVPGMTLPPNTFFMCRVEVVNEGKAVWLARGKWEKGEVRLRWRWLREDQEVPLTSGGWLIGYDVLPGQNYELTAEIATPPEPGDYTLEFGLVSMGLTSFADRGVPPLRIPLQVAREVSQR